MKSSLLLSLAMPACLLSFALERDAAACGACFHPVTQTATDVTDERMLLSVSPTQTTLYDQIRYVGNPTSFAWVLPIKGTVDVGLSADVLFDSMDVLTATQIVQPRPSCPPPPPGCGTSAAGSATGNPGDMGVMVTKQQNVGPYATVQLHATDSSALVNWLTTNGFTIPSAEQPILDQYVAEGFDFLAMKLLPNQGVQAMRPVRVTSSGASLSLPLRMARIGTGTTVGITIWVVSDGRYEPQNFPSFRIDDSELIWNGALGSSNYAQLRQQHENALGNKAWEMESSLDMPIDFFDQTVIAGGRTGPGVQPAPASDDYLPVAGSDPGDAGDEAGTDASAGQSADAVRDADLATLFAGMQGPNVRVTRMRSDILHSAMTTDLVLTASADQSPLANVRTVTQQINPQCTVYLNCDQPGFPDAGTHPSDPGTSGAADAPTSTDDQGGGCATSGALDENPLFVTIAVGLGLLALVVARKPRDRSR
jgi:hypothetical protein